MNTPLNPDAFESAWKSTEEHVKRHGTLMGVSIPDLVKHAVTAYLAVAQPVVNSDKASAWDVGFQAGWEEAKDPGAFVNDVWDSETPNPYRP